MKYNKLIIHKHTRQALHCFFLLFLLTQNVTYTSTWVKRACWPLDLKKKSTASLWAALLLLLGFCWDVPPIACFPPRTSEKQSPISLSLSLSLSLNTYSPKNLKTFSSKGLRTLS